MGWRNFLSPRYAEKPLVGEMDYMPPIANETDQDLLARAKTGDRDAFGALVSRYQVLVVSIAYSICGEFARSEDLAQEAFVAAWCRLGTLADAGRFKAWLCGIVRNLALNDSRLRRRSEGTSTVDAFEAADTAPGPRERTVSREELAIVWQTLEQLPQNYREPLILFYREHQSIALVAAALELSEDSVKQRLSRGRALLRRDLENVIERSLVSTTPRALFTTAVIGSLPALATGAAKAGAGATALKAGTLAKIAGIFPLIPAPLFYVFAALIGRREALRMTRSPDDRKFISRLWIAIGAFAVASTTVAALTARAILLEADPDRITGPIRLPVVFYLGSVFLLAAFVIIVLVAGRRWLAWARQVRMPPYVSPLRRKLWLGPDRALIYQSGTKLFGLPLIDVHFGHSREQPLARGYARGWIALGDVAYGIVFALGGFAAGGVALGGIAIGGVSVGAVAAGGGAYGLIAAGYVAVGTIFAAAVDAACGLVAMARHVASGTLLALGEHTTDGVATHWRLTNGWMTLFQSRYLPIFILGMVWLIALVGGNYILRERPVKRRPGGTA